MRLLSRATFAAFVLFGLTGCLNSGQQQAACSLASTWTVADEFRYDRDTEATGIAIDGRGTIYVAGAATTANRSSWLVRASGDQGAKWVYSDVSNATIADARPRAILSTSIGVLVSGEMGIAGAGGWLTRRIGTEGWVNEDVANMIAGTSGITGLAQADDGTILASGFGGGNGARWIVRVRDGVNGGWTGYGVDTVDAGTIVDAGRAAGVAAGSGAWIVVGGDRIRTTAGLQGRWVVRRSADRGASWTSTDLGTGGLRTQARAAAMGRDGIFYVAGTVEDATGRAHWTVRRSTNYGYTWETTDDYLPEVGLAQPNTIAVGGDGTVWVGGTVGSLNGDRWIVRRGGGKLTSWTTAEEFLATGHSSAAVNGIAFGNDGAVYAAGRSSVIGQGVRWIVRKLPCLAAATSGSR